MRRRRPAYAVHHRAKVCNACRQTENGRYGHMEAAFGTRRGNIRVRSPIAEGAYAAVEQRAPVREEDGNNRAGLMGMRWRTGGR